MVLLLQIHRNLLEMKVFKEELADECDYTREARYIRKYREMDFIKLGSRYRVPWVWDGSTEKVLVMERMNGLSVGGDMVNTLSQDDRNQVLSSLFLFSFILLGPLLRSPRKLLNYACGSSSNSERCRLIPIGQISCGIYILVRSGSCSSLYPVSLAEIALHR
jgi:ABC1 atypical kinase-like domain